MYAGHVIKCMIFSMDFAKKKIRMKYDRRRFFPFLLPDILWRTFMQVGQGIGFVAVYPNALLVMLVVLVMLEPQAGHTTLGCLRYITNYVGMENIYFEVNIIMKPTNFPPQGQPNPRKIRLKSGIWATFSHSN